MDIDNVIKDINKQLINTEVRDSILLGMRLKDIEGATEEDIEVLINHYTNKKYMNIEVQINKALHSNIPAFRRLCWCEHCEGVLDCKSDHK